RPTAQRPAQRPAAQPRQNRPQSGNIGGGRLPRGFMPLLGICAGILVIGLLLQGFMPDGFPLVKEEKASPRKTQMVTEIHSHGPLRINEIMTSNDGVIGDEDGNSPDWVEVANVSNGAVDLKGYVLARNSKAGNVFVFPELRLEAGECAIVFCDSQVRENAGGELHAPFRLSSTGDVLMLFNTADVAVDTVNIPALAQNATYARTGPETWEISTQPTPGMLNTDENYRALTTVTGNSEVQLAEVMSSSATYAPDENGVCHDYVILKNVTGSDVDVGGWYLSDTQTTPRMWRIPAGVTIPGGGTLTIHCSGLNRTDDPQHLHTSFKLSSEGEQVILSDASGRPRDMVTFDLLKTDTAIVRAADGSWSVGNPTAAHIEPTPTK
ncbi:MAG: lamin tail domain-containing protein, partial [Clostridia bacterium]|nr:lamin tail domain-containing protein [Clostridia bacterium]